MRENVRLAEFILSDMEAILTHWEAFAAQQLPAAGRMTPLALRDHAQQILEAVAKDLRNPQTRQAQSDKSLGRAPRPIDAAETAAETHALLRARSGFDINQLAAEYRALRASVLRLWMDKYPPEEQHVEDIIRFNEAIDQAVAESITFFSAQVEQARNLFLGMLGHDLRSPLQTIQVTAAHLAALNAGSDISDAASRLISSGARMKALLDDLVDFNRTRLGLGMNIARREIDIAHVVAEELKQLRAAHPGREIALEISGNTVGRWDRLRLQQMLSNLVVNAIKYGASDLPIRILVTGNDADVVIEVRNSGPTIDPATLQNIFDPLMRGATQMHHNQGDASLGLGLFIAREIATAHGGTIAAHSGDSETAFVVQLPRDRSA